jgi:hypothetical protein
MLRTTELEGGDTIVEERVGGGIPRETFEEFKL